ncbi:hypothetical protein [Pseudoclavibacter sp. Z016]|uniref:hypothetical protein n=1 Tax=Pseudoclavibacter sp. Z016 TaxID=2080581 RepID=UPI0011AFEFC9|nr:hypothetical protein [Pseudoclavibacter sp. Z016]
MTGETVASVQRAFPAFTDSSIRRHHKNHVQAKLVAKLGTMPTMNSADLSIRLVALADDVQAVRNRAVVQNNSSATLRAANSELTVLRELISTLGISDTDATALMAEASALAQAVGQVARDYPDFGRILAAELASDAPELSSTILAISANRTSLNDKETP